MRLEHIGIIVKDIGETSQWFECLGWGPFSKTELYEYNDGKVSLWIKKYGNIELISISKGELPYSKLGFHHIGIRVDMDSEMQAFMQYKKLASLSREGVYLEYYDTIKEVGYITELVQRDK